jgi:hypothetical protein
VLRGLDLDRFAPRFMLVEIVSLDGDHRAAVEAVLGSQYAPLGRTSIDVLYGFTPH